MPLPKVSTTKGLTHVQTHCADSSEEIVKALQPYLGCQVHLDIPWRGHYTRQWVELVDARDGRLTVRSRWSDTTWPFDAWDVAGTYETLIRTPPRKQG